MRWEGRRESRNIEDRRGVRVPGGRGVGFGCGTIIFVIVVSWLTGANPIQLLGLLSSVQQMAPPPDVRQAPAERPSADDPQRQFVSVVLADTEDVWNEVLSGRYREPTLVLFEGHVESACGLTSAAVGPFYCSGDEKVYLDLSFFRELSQRFGAPGDFARAYVVAHEVGHHVQNLLGVSDRVSRLERRARSREEANALSIRLELQADCFAGVFGYHDRKYLDPGDVEEGLRAAAAIGDDMIQRQAQGYVAPESWTHGSSQMRVRWLRRGLEQGDPEACDTFGAAAL
jgi:predicted metalloprotease